MNGFGSGMMDGSGTIDPAALNSSSGSYQTSKTPSFPSSDVPGSASSVNLRYIDLSDGYIRRKFPSGLFFG